MLRELALNGVVHGDVKLDNVLYTGPLESESASRPRTKAILIKMIDFGTSELVAEMKDGYVYAHEVNPNDAG